MPETELNQAFHDLITKEEAKDLVKKVVSSKAEFVDYQLRPFSKETLGFLGSHLCLIVVFRRPGRNYNETQSFFVKTLPFHIPLQATYVQEKGCIRKETKFFESVVPLMTNNFKGETWLAKSYLVKQNVMVLEDLKAQGFSNRARLLDEKSMEVALGCIARMHAASLLAEERIQGSSLRDLFPETFEESEFKREGLTYTTYKVGSSLAIDLANDLGLDSTNVRRTCERVFDVGRSSKTKRNVVCHGDLWSSNIVFDQENHCRLVDFQTIRYLPPGHDVILLIYWCTSKDIRQKNERRFFEYYYRVLQETLKSNDFKGDVPSFQEILQTADELRPAALTTATVFDPITLMDGHTAAKIMNDPITYQPFYFGDRKFFVYEYMKTNPEYSKRIKDNVRELVEMSLILDTIPKYT